MASRRHVQYSPLAADDIDEDHGMLGEGDLRFAYNPKALDRVPWKSIALAIFLLALGTLLLILSFFIFTGHMEGEQSQAYGLLTLGILAFLPGRWIYYIYGERYMEISAWSKNSNCHQVVHTHHEDLGFIQTNVSTRLGSHITLGRVHQAIGFLPSPASPPSISRSRLWILDIVLSQ
ncbi:hypothetical protein MUK42_13874 [Musa troglodytarum]|uniref:Transmembrane protein 230 n=1 Tax=Musa troglodytarum TaxID=320322 RepID=A0A9E7I9I9_9LILI|nr:hypothetical protein MUK42_13874 [Musa troglodytarum]